MHSHCLISYREGLGTSLWIMGLATIDPHNQKEHTEIHKIRYLDYLQHWNTNDLIQRIQTRSLPMTTDSTYSFFYYKIICLVINFTYITFKNSTFTGISLEIA